MTNAMTNATNNTMTSAPLESHAPRAHYLFCRRQAPVNRRRPALKGPTSLRNRFANRDHDAINAARIGPWRPCEKDFTPLMDHLMIAAGLRQPAGDLKA
ncbi:hypothetical protein [Cucumibacter marinus]|uniref:hypothetical protein n=1 Tax=Cucumibacter marinus TaxID=1121252 RepID=UPI00048AF8C8|nr:hypothetical protein [Cucumibacter marinus]